ncbi:MAG: prepilin-type N-terminal cleavage/methylation domain-containing protein [Spartobacteria bacterium]|nr:prepilin-type N-terminal cleavage/methylation domain-containing protein [Spartobacteria bacterium]
MRCGGKQRGFTLIEVLLVVVIMLISMGVAVPYFMSSFRGAKLRATVRTIIMASRYARATAVLQQMDTAILFDRALGTIEIVGIKSTTEKDKFLDESGPISPGAEEDSADNYSVNTLLKKTIESDVEIVELTSDGNLEEVDGIYGVNYYANGMCDQYTIVLRDQHNTTVTIDIDPLSAKAKLDYSQ